eukprot:g31092.t1
MEKLNTSGKNVVPGRAIRIAGSKFLPRRSRSPNLPASPPPFASSSLPSRKACPKSASLPPTVPLGKADDPAILLAACESPHTLPCRYPLYPTDFFTSLLTMPVQTALRRQAARFPFLGSHNRGTISVLNDETVRKHRNDLTWMRP